ncbi:hypothetical protein OIU78_026302, partial [Salix suchowensis]
MAAMSPFANFEQPGRSFTMRRIPFDQGIGIAIYGHRIREDGKHNHKNTQDLVSLCCYIVAI